MSNIVEEIPVSQIGIAHSSIAKLVVRDGKTGEIKDVRYGHNDKLNATYSALISAMVNSGFNGVNSIVICGVSSSDAIAVTDVSLTDEVGDGSLRTYGNLSWDAANPAWNLSWSFTNNAVSYSIGTAGIFWTFTGDGLYLKASFAHVIVSSQDSLFVAWLQSLSSA